MTLCGHDTVVPSLQCFRSDPFGVRRRGIPTPLPRPVAEGSPFLLTLGGYPTAPSIFARGQGVLRGSSPLRLTCYVSPLITEGLQFDFDMVDFVSYVP
jgi:hypothetical protein